MSKLIVICLVGAPCSGKSTWIEENLPILAARHKTNVVIISKDVIRKSFPQPYIMCVVNEKVVTEKFYKQLSTASTLEEGVIILDNCHMQNKHMAAYLTTFQSLINSGKMEFYVEFFKIPYWKAWIRNIIRKIKTGKYIPLDHLKAFYKAYPRIDISPYKIYSKTYGK
jgi:predicted kinase